MELVVSGDSLPSVDRYIMGLKYVMVELLSMFDIFRFDILYHTLPPPPPHSSPSIPPPLPELSVHSSVLSLTPWYGG